MSRAETAAPRGLWTSLRTHVVGRRLVRDVSLLTAANVVDAGLGVLQAMIVARWLGPARYGASALAMTYPALLFTLLDPRATDASVKYLGEFASRREDERAAAMCTVGYAVDLLTAAAALALVAVTAGWAVTAVVHEPALRTPMLLFTAAFLPRALAGTSTAALTTLGRFHLLAAATALQAMLRTTLVVTLVTGGAGAAGVLYGNAIAMAAGGVGLTVVAYPALVARWGRAPLRRAWAVLAGHRRAIASFLLYNDLNAFLGALVKQLDVLVLGWLRGPTDAGYYRLAKSLGTTLGLVVSPLQGTTYPRFARLVGLERRAELRATVRQYAWRVGAPLGAAVLLALPLVPVVIDGVVGARYLPAAATAQIVLAGAALWTAGFWVRPYLLAAGGIRDYTRLYLLSLLPFVASFALAPHFGPAGLAAGYLAHNLLLLAAGARRVLR